MSAQPTIGVVDYGSGNLRSVCKALERCGGRPLLANSADSISGVAGLVVPGVGSFGDCVRNLHQAGLWDPVLDWLRHGRPYLGICLGYQLLFEGSDESPGVPGLGYLEGHVVRFPRSHLKVPHMGWNDLNVINPHNPLYRGVGQRPCVYFVHSYFPSPADPSIISATCEYGTVFAASISIENTHATQFHPEKSQSVGLAILRNFLVSLA